MKRLLPLLLLLFSINANAQDYACIIPTDTSYFINADGYLRGIKIDSVRAIGSDTVYYPFKTDRRYTATWPTSEFDTSRGCWLGSKIVKQPDGIFRFHTFWLDTVFVNTAAMPGDSWIFYNDTTARWYLASLTSVDTQTIKGVIDSVKKIQITAYLGSTVNPLDSIHGFEILLSKSHGFASVFDLYTYPYFSPTGSAYPNVFSEQIGYISPVNYFFRQIEFHVPTLHDLYDFSVGDVFVNEYAEWSPESHSSSRSLDSIVSKTIESPTRTVYATEHRDRGTIWSMSSSTTTYSYNEGSGGYLADSTPAFHFTMPEESPKWQTVWHYRPYDTSNCTIGSFYSMEFIVLFEGCPLSFKYKTGLPQVRRESNTPPWPSDIGCHSRSDESLVYFVKNSAPCGTPTGVPPIDIYDIPTRNTAFIAYPNPTSETIHIKGIPESTNVYISDITGRQIITSHTTANETSIDISQLTPGTYIIRVNDMRQTFTKQ